MRGDVDAALREGKNRLFTAFPVMASIDRFEGFIVHGLHTEL